MKARARRPLTTNGFTIVETIMVLGIAAFILLITFEALPALQRSSRNNQRRQDVQAVLRAVGHYEQNNSGNFPDCGYSPPLATPSCYGSGNLLAYAKLTYYSSPSSVVVHPGGYVTTGQVVVHSEPSGTTLTAVNDNPDPDPDTIYVYNHQLCTNNNQQATAQAAAVSDVVALYAIETGGGISSVCQQL